MVCVWAIDAVTEMTEQTATINVMNCKKSRFIGASPWVKYDLISIRKRVALASLCELKMPETSKNVQKLRAEYGSGTTTVRRWACSCSTTIFFRIIAWLPAFIFALA